METNDQEPNLPQVEQPIKPAAAPSARHLFGSRGKDIAAGLLAVFLTPIVSGLLANVRPAAGLVALIGIVLCIILVRVKNPAAASFFKTYMVVALAGVGISALILGACWQIVKL